MDALAFAGVVGFGTLWAHARHSAAKRAGITSPRPRATPKDATTSLFAISDQNGYLPRTQPYLVLPTEYEQLEKIMANLPEILHAADPAALAKLVGSLPQYDVSGIKDRVLQQSLYRDYAILVSAYLLEGKTKSGRPRTRVPRNISIPFSQLAAALDQHMIMSYDSYALSNSYHTSSTGPATTATEEADGIDYTVWERDGWEHLRLVRAFDGGPEETTFVTVHVEIESHTPHLIAVYQKVLRELGLPTSPAAARGSSSGTSGAGSGGGSGAGSAPLPTSILPVTPTPSTIASMKTILRELAEVLDRIIVSQLKMFNASDPRNYEAFVRPWIFGWRGNPDFPDGVVFEGVNGDAPTSLRGETGAQSTIVPTMDLIVGITHRSDELRRMLNELEAYRPAPHREYLTFLRTMMFPTYDGSAGAVPTSLENPHRLREFVTAARDTELATLFNQCVGRVWAFRDIHVTFSDMYIARYTNKETATGGTPYKVYLRKHRDESMSHQLTGPSYTDEVLMRFDLPSVEAARAEIEEALSTGSANGIPGHLLRRHEAAIRKYGGGSPSLSRKAFPAAAAVSRWAVAHPIAPGASTSSTSVTTTTSASH